MTGMDFMIEKRIAKKWWILIMQMIRIQRQYRKITLIKVHTPTENKPEEEKDEIFYKIVEYDIKNIPIYDVKIVLGDFNAKVGREEIYKDVTV